MRTPIHDADRAFALVYHGSLWSLSRAVFVNFGLVESAVSPVGGVGDRHVKHKHRIVHPFPRRRGMGSNPIIGSEGSEAFLRVSPLAAMPRFVARAATAEMSRAPIAHRFCRSKS
jgi:hypothetical protein